jgi:hypothetical protein
VLPQRMLIGGIRGIRVTQSRLPMTSAAAISAGGKVCATATYTPAGGCAAGDANAWDLSKAAQPLVARVGGKPAANRSVALFGHLQDRRAVLASISTWNTGDRF